MKTFDQVVQQMSRRAAAYKSVFLNSEKIDVRPVWRRLIQRRPAEPSELNPVGETVMRDLAQYCYATKPTIKISAVTQQSDALAMAFAEGRRDVFNRITHLLNLDQEQIRRIANHRSNHDEN